MRAHGQREPVRSMSLGRETHKRRLVASWAKPATPIVHNASDTTAQQYSSYQESKLTPNIDMPAFAQILFGGTPAVA
jgi:hypothetical protein